MSVPPDDDYVPLGGDTNDYENSENAQPELSQEVFILGVDNEANNVPNVFANVNANVNAMLCMDKCNQ